MKAGKYRRVRRIQERLDKHRITFADVARRLEISRTLVSMTAHGHSNNRRVLECFLELGVRHEDLDLPAGMLAGGEKTKRMVA